MITKVKNAKAVLPDHIEENAAIYFEDGVICAIGGRDRPFDHEIDAQGCYVAPGFIDLHVHGGGGFDFMDGGTEVIAGAAQLHLTHGTTSLLATTLACSDEVLIEFLNDLRAVMESGVCPQILGAHLEGPYFSQAQSGAQNPAYIKPPVPEKYNRILQAGEGLIRRWSFAPELAGAPEFCKTLIAQGIVPSIGHSDAVFSDVQCVYELGCRSVTHLYSGMSTITRENGYRRLGVVEATYLLDGMKAEIIADGRHLPAELLQLIIKQLGSENICLVTDAMRGAGMPDGPSLLGRQGEGMDCVIEDGVAKLPDRSAFAGSVATADRLVRTMVELAGVPLCDAVRMMTANPADMLGLPHKGRLLTGCDADLVFFDETVNVRSVLLGGTVVM